MRYRVKVLANGSMQELNLDAEDEQSLRHHLDAQGLMLVAAKPERSFSLSLRKTRFDLSLFTQELIALLDAGLGLIETVETLRDKGGNEGGRQVLERIVASLYEGLPLSKALAAMPAQFPPLYVATVASAEKTGHLAAALRRYHQYDARLAGVRKKVSSALVYPLVIMAVGGLIILFLLFYVVPRFSEIYASVQDLPVAAKAMLWWGDLVKAQGMGLLLAIVAAVAGLVFALRTAPVRTAVAEVFWRIPRMASLRHLFGLARFYRTVGLLLSGGLPVVTCLQMSAQVLPASMKPGLLQVLSDVSAGQPLSASMPRHGLTTAVAERLLRVGEQSGDLAVMFERAAQFCDEELDRAIDTFTKLFEPLLMLVIGGMVGVIVFLLYMPIFQLAGNVE